MRTVIYARYSSKLQDERSIEDQIAVCRERADREGWEIVDVFTDYEISGKVWARPGLQAMLARVEAGGIDQVLAEAMDRIARSQIDSPRIREKIIFAGARLFTLSQGEVSELHTAFQGAMDALQLKELAAKVRRGQKGRTAKGFQFGGPAYGYRILRRIGANGEVELGLREIDPDQAEIVRRIFREFLEGRSPLAIARSLNAEGVPGPTGGMWRTSTINGDRIRRNGILQNDLYAGRLVYNKTRKEVDPETRRRVIRSNPASAWQTTVVPELRIVSDETWAAVSAHRERVEGVPAHRQRRQKRLLSGLGRCGVCGGGWNCIGTKDRWGCSNRRDAKGCTNNRTITNAEYERRVLDGLHREMLDPEAVELYLREYRRNFAELARGREAAARPLRKTLEESSARVKRLVAALADGDADFPEIRAAMLKAREERDAAQAQLEAIAQNTVVDLHPRLADRYREEFANVSAALDSRDDDTKRAAMPTIRSLIDWIEVRPAGPEGEGRGTEIEVFGRLRSILSLAAGDNPADACRLETVPGARHGHKPTFLKAVV